MNRSVLFLLCLLLLGFFSYNYSNFGGNWVYHPDDQADYIFAQNYARTGSLYLELSPQLRENAVYPESSVRTPSGAGLLKSVGSIMLLAPGMAINGSAPFFLVPIFGFAALIFIYLLLSRRYGSLVGALAATLFGMSVFFVSWSNMLFSNVPAFCFFISGVYYLDRYAASKSAMTGVLSTTLMSVAFLIRYEYAAFVGILLLFYAVKHWYLARQWEFKHVVILGVAPVVLGMVLLLSNHAVYGSFLSLGYTSQSVNAVNEISNPLVRIYQRQLAHLFSAEGSPFSENFSQFVYAQLGILLVAGILGIVLLRKKLLRDELLSALLVTGLFWLWFVLNAQYWGFGTDFVMSTYTRLLFICYFVVVAFCALFLASLLRKGTFFRYAVVLFVVLFLVLSTTVYTGRLGLAETLQEKHLYREVNLRAEKLPQNAILAGNILTKGVVSRPVVNPLPELPKDVRRERVIDIIMNLTSQGRPVYVVEDPWHAGTYLNILNGLAERNVPFELADEFESTYRGRQVRIYLVKHD